MRIDPPATPQIVRFGRLPALWPVACLASLALASLALVSCGGSHTQVTAPMPDFSLTSAPASVTLIGGGPSQQISVNAVPSNGFQQSVTVAVTGLPTGVTASPATLTLTPGTAKSITLAATSSAAAATTSITLTGTSGSLSHSATVATTVSAAAPAPDFALSATPTSLTLVGGQTGSAIEVQAVGLNSFSLNVTITVAITGIPASVTPSPAALTLTTGVPQSVTFTAAGSATKSTNTITFTATSGSLTHTATVALTVQPSTALASAPDVTTYHNDVARDGLNSSETILNLSNVNSTDFGKIGFDSVDGLVDAEPLFLANVTAGGKLRNVLYFATEHDSVYAFDADTGAQIWKTSILGSNETTSDDHGCGQITPEIGITSTPVIDRHQGANGTLFTVGMSKDKSGNYHQRLHALDITTGAEIGGSPTEIAAKYPGSGDNTSNGNVVFDASQYAERAALLLLNGVIYTTWTSHCDDPPYTGWVIAYSESTLKQSQVLNVTPNGSEGSIWMSGDGPAADSSGNLYFLDANGTFDTTFDSNGFPASGDFGNAILKLSTSGKLAVVDYFETYNTNMESSDDIDLGSGGEVLLPDMTDASGTVRHLLVGAGKDANIYLADRDSMGKFKAGASSDSYIYQIVTGALSGPVFSTPAYFNGTLYYGAVNDNLRAFPIANARLQSTSSSQSATSFSYPGTTPSVSANGSQDGIVWALESSTSHPAVLHAYDASNLARELYNSTQAAKSRDSFGTGNKFITPLIVNGKVYVGTATGVAVFGLLTTP